MGYIVEWIVDKRVASFKGEGDVTIEEVEDAVERLTKLLDEGEAPLHTISDSRSIGKFPTSLSTLKKLMTPHPKATGWSILIQDNTATRFISEMLTRFSGQSKIRSFTNLKEAFIFLERIDPSLGTIDKPELD